MKNCIHPLLTLVAILIGFTANVATAAEPPHPYHVSLAEVNWNAKSQNFEVALCLWPADLEKALTRQTGRPIDLEKEANIDRLMEAYIAKRFTIHSTDNQAAPHKTADSKQAESTPWQPAASAKPQASASHTPTSLQNPLVAPPTPITSTATNTPTPPKMKWHGHEADAKQVWLYFEITGNPKANWTAENRVFFELNDDQLNHVQWNGTGKTETLVCNADSARIVLPKK